MGVTQLKILSSHIHISEMSNPDKETPIKEFPDRRMSIQDLHNYCNDHLQQTGDETLKTIEESEKYSDVNFWHINEELEKNGWNALKW